MAKQHNNYISAAFKLIVNGREKLGASSTMGAGEEGTGIYEAARLRAFFSWSRVCGRIRGKERESREPEAKLRASSAGLLAKSFAFFPAYSLEFMIMREKQILARAIGFQTHRLEIIKQH